jgi:hypothetical protein
MGFEIKKIDCFQCVTGQVGIVFKKTSLQSFVSKDPTKALKVPALIT